MKTFFKNVKTLNKTFAKLFRPLDKLSIKQYPISYVVAFQRSTAKL